VLYCKLCYMIISITAYKLQNRLSDLLQIRIKLETMNSFRHFVGLLGCGIAHCKAFTYTGQHSTKRNMNIYPCLIPLFIQTKTVCTLDHESTVISYCEGIKYTTNHGIHRILQIWLKKHVLWIPHLRIPFQILFYQPKRTNIFGKYLISWHDIVTGH
jgi:hypothetical protein